MQVTPYLTYDGTAEQAFQHYARVLGGKIEMLMRYGEAPAGAGCDGMSEADQRKVMHISLSGRDFMLMASDANALYPYEGVKGISVSLNLESADEAERVFAGLAEGGNVTMPLTATFWAERFGCVTDAWGVPWMINVQKQD